MKTMANTVQVGELLLGPRKARQFPDAGLPRQRQIPVNDGREVGDSCWQAKIRHQSPSRPVAPPKPKTMTASLIFS